MPQPYETVRMLRDREQGKRNEFLLQGLRLKLELDEFRLSQVERLPQRGGSRSGLGRQVAAAVLAIGVQAALPTGQAMAEPTPAPMQQAGGRSGECCTLSGNCDPIASGAAIANVTITITNIATNRAITLKTDNIGQYAAKDLTAGKYDVTAVGKRVQDDGRKGRSKSTGPRPHARISGSKLATGAGAANMPQRQ